MGTPIDWGVNFETSEVPNSTTFRPEGNSIAVTINWHYFPCGLYVGHLLGTHKLDLPIFPPSE